MRILGGVLCGGEICVTRGFGLRGGVWLTGGFDVLGGVFVFGGLDVLGGLLARFISSFMVVKEGGGVSTIRSMLVEEGLVDDDDLGFFRGF